MARRWQSPGTMTAPSPSLRAHAATHVGRRDNNEDSFLADRPLGLFAVADGMGGYEGGEIASHLAVDTLYRFFSRGAPYEDITFTSFGADGRSPAESMMQMALRLADAEIKKQRNGRLASMGSTIAAILMRGEHAVIAHVGDSRVYGFRDGALMPLTIDHSLYAEMVAAGISRTRARDHRHVVTRALGVPGRSRPDVATFAVRSGDAFLLCTDGVTDVLPDGEIEAILSELDPARAVDAIVAEAYVSGSPDNITVLHVRVE